MYQFLQDLPGDTLKAAVLATCAGSRRTFAPSVGEIREAALKLSARAQAIPNEFEAWKEMREMAPNMLRTITMEESTQADLATFDEHGRLLIYQAALQWSHPLVEKMARQFGWPDFPGENESVDRRTSSRLTGPSSAGGWKWRGNCRRCGNILSKPAGMGGSL